MRDKLTTALALLKKASGSRGYLYEQPWYAIIGPPGAGKTTALLNAGLSFPLAAEMGQSAVAGVGGTRMCDWWFTESAVLIDTAGRYTTQDSDAAVDKAGWQAFLGLLKRTRARQPLNGVLVAIALSDIAAAPRRGAARACPGDPPPGEGTLRPAWRARAGLCAVHQGRPDRRLHRVLRRPGSRAARPGLGHDLSAEQDRRRHRRPVRRRVQAAGRAAEPAPARPAAGRAQPRPAHADRRLSRPGRPASPRRSASSSPRRSAVRGSIRRRCCAASI